MSVLEAGSPAHQSIYANPEARKALFGWLVTHGLDPNDVVSVDAADAASVTVTEYVRTDAGAIAVRGAHPQTRTRTLPALAPWPFL